MFNPIAILAVTHITVCFEAACAAGRLHSTTSTSTKLGNCCKLLPKAIIDRKS